MWYAYACVIVYMCKVCWLACIIAQGLSVFCVASGCVEHKYAMY